ncbi:protein involved in Golgi retention and vacuolar sorting [Scheffersomyces stipitis CBS 6054]|uniref:Protein involved in Golgi retention and vacuolar sorting n=1 Tax=Scheffersomyces stipitis (strain ATCC 58785 / CBS 6054 / NBRC 10063 / NRRL Y-11545) TaxID=322104 RepID=A3GF04_PICST|nr:protein involved in Golgi retention and vacuolar sorting [Scheffersomyces stipitis CBS 6054]EAZ63673.2 protein involved in Golgi retention and vacuolar sorting [Scheffersomyces stipitis CBS 6054]
MEQDDLTASVWDDVVSPHSEPATYGNVASSSSGPLAAEFNDMSIQDEQENEDKESNEDTNHENYDHHQEEQNRPYDYNHNEDYHYNTNSSFNTNSNTFNTGKLKKEERKEHTHQLLSELTQGAEDSELLRSGTVSPKAVTSAEALFNDKDSPIKMNKAALAESENLKSPRGKIKLKTSSFKTPRPRKFNAKVNVSHLQGTENSEKNPLGPLGSESDDSKGDKASVISSSRAEILFREAEAPLYEIQHNSKTSPQKPVSDEQKNGEDARDDLNQLEITVGDPMKVGDITTAHIVYAIRTKNKNPNATSFPGATDEFITVSRRYKDFRWIYHQLQNNHPGRIIPPPPTKQTYIGRFNENFIENRRLSLEKMLNKISNISVLSNDADFVMFLTSEDFINESRERERLSGSGASTQNNDFLDNATTLGDDGAASTASLSSSVSTPIISGGGSGFMSSLFSISTKINEPDEYFSHKRQYVDELEYNLKQFYNAIELVGTQRIDMIGVLDEISLAIDELANLEISKVTTELLSAFSEVQLKIKENLDRINLQDQLTLGFTIEEYLRIIGSIKFVFETRSKIYQQYYNFNQELLKKSSQLDKLTRKYKAPVDKVNSLTFEVDKLKQKTSAFENSFNSISETIKEEMENFEYEKIEDFRNSVEIFIESSIESQKEAIELYETFYERQNLASV